MNAGGTYFHCPTCVLLWKTFEDTKVVIRNRKWKDRQYNGKKTKDKRTNNDLQNITQKTNVRTTRTPLIIEGETWCSGRFSSSCSICAPIVGLLNDTNII